MTEGSTTLLRQPSAPSPFAAGPASASPSASGVGGSGGDSGTPGTGGGRSRRRGGRGRGGRRSGGGEGEGGGSGAAAAAAASDNATPTHGAGNGEAPAKPGGRRRRPRGGRRHRKAGKGTGDVVEGAGVDPEEDDDHPSDTESQATEDLLDDEHDAAARLAAMSVAEAALEGAEADLIEPSPSAMAFDPTAPTVALSTATPPGPALLALPNPAVAVKLGGKKGVPVILSRHNVAPAVTDPGADGVNGGALAGAAGGDEPAATEASSPARKKRSSRRKKKKADDGAEPEDAVAAEPEPEPVSAVVALERLKGQAVSITADTQVTIRRVESQGSIGGAGDGKYDADGTNNAFTGQAAAAAASKTKKTGKKKKGRSGHLGPEDAASQQLARRFNQQVRTAVDQSDLTGIRELLHDKRNHHFALDANVLETVQKAFMTAALFDDALYCLRNCTLPGTMTLAQTERVLLCLPQNLRNSSAYMAADLMNALCIATHFDSAKKRTYFLRIVRGIALEFLEEATSARDRICSAPCERLVRAGLCIVDARLKRGKKAADLIVIPGNQLCFVPENMEQRGIAPGDAVSILPYAGPYPMSAESLDRNMIEATVANINPIVLRLQDKLNTNLYAALTEPIEGNVYRIDKLANRMGFNRQLNAAVAIASPIDDTVRDFRRPCPQLIEAITSMDENIIRFNGALPRGEMTSTAGLCSESIPWNVEDEGETFDAAAARESNRLALEKFGAFEGLNPSQCLALEGATTNRLSLVQGPPGTGKTALALRVLQHWARLRRAAAKNGEKPAPILATSDSNIAVDNLVEGCAAIGLRVVRLGRPESVRPELLRYCIDRPPSQYGSGQDRGGGGYQSQMASYKERVKQMKDAEVICCTCIGAGSDILDMFGPLEHILVDEATQATEPAILVPLTRGCRQLVLVGDHCQLPPTVLSTRAEEEGHGVPLFSRMVACGVPPFMLDTQYRMHPYIAQFPSDLFYGGLLKSGVSAPERRPLQGFQWPREEFPVAYIPVYGREMDDGVSKYNEDEAAVACDAVAALMSGGQCSVSDIAVVTPYAAQARLIRRLLRQFIGDKGPPFVEVSSVDGFQGREKEAIVFSAVRSNDYGAIGFTSDWRRVNVSFTRARRALIVIGNDQTLRRGDPDTWMPWLAWADAQGVNMSNPGIPRGRYEPEQLRRVRGGTTAAEMLKDVLERQQAQLKTAEMDQQRAEKNARGHITGGGGSDDGGEAEDGIRRGLSLEEDLALLANTEGNWDDSEDDEPVLRHSASKATLTSATSSNDIRSNNDSDAVDIWDL